MYSVIGNTVTITGDDWLRSGLSYGQYRGSQQRGKLKLVQRRKTFEDSVISFDSISDNCYLRVIERKFGKVDITGDTRETAETDVHINPNAREFFAGFLKPNGQHLEFDKILEHTNCASIISFGIEQKTQRVSTLCVPFINKKNYFFIAAIPGSSMPSIASSNAPPPVET